MPFLRRLFLSNFLATLLVWLCWSPPLTAAISSTTIASGAQIGTYQVLATAPNGDLYLAVQISGNVHGGTGVTDFNIYKWTVGNPTWTLVTNVNAGAGLNQFNDCMYQIGMAVDASNVIHIALIETGTAADGSGFNFYSWQKGIYYGTYSGSWSAFTGVDTQAAPVPWTQLRDQWSTPLVRFDASGKVVIAFKKNLTGPPLGSGGERIHVATETGVGTNTFGAPATVDSNNGSTVNYLVADGSGNLSLVYTLSASSNVAVATSSNWASSTLAINNAGVTQFGVSGAATDSAGKLHLLFNDNAGTRSAFGVVSNASGSWTTPAASLIMDRAGATPVDAPDYSFGANGGLVIDGSDNKFFLVYHSPDGSTYDYYYIYGQAGGTSTWVTGYQNLAQLNALTSSLTNYYNYQINPLLTANGLLKVVQASNNTSITTVTDVSGLVSDFVLLASGPTVTSVSPAIGAPGGGDQVTIHGTLFTGVTSVKFGATEATSFTFDSDTQITATSPGHASGTVDVVITAGGLASATSSSDHFLYAAEPTVVSISISSGPLAGGTSLVITGTDFTGVTAVKFGTNSATFTFDSATQITATIPAGSAGTVDVTVTTPGGTSATSGLDQYTYMAAPTVSSLSVTGGPLGGGTSTVITGTGFIGVTSVKFGSTNASGFTVISATQITATIPAGSAGTVDVTVTTAGGTSATGNGDHFTYFAVPTVSSLSVSSGPLGGGTSLVITGTNFTGVTAVKFGSTDATGFTFDSATQITATIPAGSAGMVDVTVITPGGTSATGSGDHYTYVAAPTITSISIASGPLAGGGSMVITGTHFTGVTAVKFGTNSATFTFDSATQITATIPGGSAGTVDVTVTTPGGTSATSGLDQYTYMATPMVSSLSVTGGPLGGGTSTVITGTGFIGVTSVTFGSTNASGFTVNSITQITATIPAGSAGTVDVTVTTPGGTSATVAGDQYTYAAAPTVSSLSVSSGPLAGGTTLVITGTNFTGVTAVKFGTSNATSFTFDSATQITATIPGASAGMVDVTVTTAGGTSATVVGDHYTYMAAPTVSSLSVSSGPLAGGTTLVITGTNFTGVTAVKFGTSNATSFTLNSATQITTTIPAASAGMVDVTVTTPGGTSTTVVGDRYTYVAAPTVTGLSVTNGPTGGGTSVIITGTGLIGASAVKFGLNNVTSFTINSGTQISTTAPAGSLGTVDVTVTTIGGTSALGLGDQFSYFAAPTVTTQTVTSVTPTSAIGNGNLTATNGANATTEGVVVYPWSNSDKQIGETGVINFATSGNFGNGAFTAALSPLAVNTQFNARAYASNAGGTGYGARVAFWTLANVPGAPTVNSPTNTSLNVLLNVNGNPAGTEFCIQEATSGKYVQADGRLGPDPVWQIAAVWGTRTVTGLYPGATVTFQAKARNGQGTETGFGASASGMAFVPPSITRQPGNATVLAGGNTSFTVTATGTIMGYHWQVNGGSGFTNLSDGGVYSGSSSATLSILGAGAELNGYSYRVLVVPYSSSAVTSSSAVLTVNAPPAITTQPVDVHAPIAGPATFFVVATGMPAPSYRWQRSNDGGTTWNDLASAISATYGLASAALVDNGARFRVVVSNGIGSPVTSSVARLSVSSAVNDFNGDGTSDLLWRNSATGLVEVIPMDNGAPQAGAGVWFEPSPAWQIVATADLDGDGKADQIWWNSLTGQVFGILMNGTTVKASGPVYFEPDTSWRIVAAADFGGTGKAGLLWRHSVSGLVYLMPMNGLVPQPGGVIWVEADPAWQIMAAADFDGDGKAEVLWQNRTSGLVFLMKPNGIGWASGDGIYSEPNRDWLIVGAGDFAGTGTASVLWRNLSNGQVFVMPMSGGIPQPGTIVWTEASKDWHIAAIGDYDGDGKADILWWNSATGQVYQVLMNGTGLKAAGFIYVEPNVTWTLQGGGTVPNP
jgi:hypothetical protein